MFSCGGGLDLGLEGGFTCFDGQVNTRLHADWISDYKDNGRVLLRKNNFDTIFANDIDSHAKRTWEAYFSQLKQSEKIHYTLESIVSLVKKAEVGAFSFPQADIVTGGFPCCDFSVAGKRQGFSSLKSDTEDFLDSPSIESRGMLYYWMKRVIDIVQPKMFIAENVDGLVSLGDTKKVIENDFSNGGRAGYIVVPAKVLHAGDYGIPQSRRRVIFFGFNKEYLRSVAVQELSKQEISSEYDPYPIMTHAWSTRDDKNLLPYFTVGQVLSGLAEPGDSHDSSQNALSHAKWLSKGQGQTEVSLNGLAPTIRAKHHGNIEFRRLSIEHGGTHIDELKNGLMERRLTVRECARIQSFPDEYDFVMPKDGNNPAVSTSAAYVIVGNAVPPLLAYNIGANIQEKWNIWFKD